VVIQVYEEGEAPRNTLCNGKAGNVSQCRIMQRAGTCSAAYALPAGAKVLCVKMQKMYPNVGTNVSNVRQQLCVAHKCIKCFTFSHAARWGCGRSSGRQAAGGRQAQAARGRGGGGGGVVGARMYHTVQVRPEEKGRCGRMCGAGAGHSVLGVWWSKWQATGWGVVWHRRWAAGQGSAQG